MHDFIDVAYSVLWSVWILQSASNTAVSVVYMYTSILPNFDYSASVSSFSAAQMYHLP